MPVPEAAWGPPAPDDQQDEPPREKRRMDWSEYLDDNREHHGGLEVAGSQDYVASEVNFLWREGLERHLRSALCLRRLISCGGKGLSGISDQRWWHIQTSSIIEGSVLIMSRTGVGLAMFSMGELRFSYLEQSQELDERHVNQFMNWLVAYAGLFMPLQEKIVVCGAGLTGLGMALRFIAGPAATAAGAVALGLRGENLRLAIIHVRFYRFYL
ncbi:hypothetical protein ACQ4PT_052139 [Festuca glaucescens]